MQRELARRTAFLRRLEREEKGGLIGAGPASATSLLVLGERRRRRRRLRRQRWPTSTTTTSSSTSSSVGARSPAGCGLARQPCAQSRPVGRARRA